MELRTPQAPPANAPITVASYSRDVSEREESEVLERVLDIRFTRYGTVLEGLELVCCMTGFRLHQRALGRIEFREHS